MPAFKIILSITMQSNWGSSAYDLCLRSIRALAIPTIFHSTSQPLFKIILPLTKQLVAIIHLPCIWEMWYRLHTEVCKIILSLSLEVIWHHSTTCQVLMCVWPISGLPIQVHGVIKPQICSPKSVHSHLLILTYADQLKLVQYHYWIQNWTNHSPFSGTTKSPTHPVAYRGLPDVQNT